MTQHIFEYPLASDISLHKLHQELKSKFPYHSETRHRVERVYQDSFDCRLYKSGFEYFVEMSDSQTSLFIHPVNSLNQVQMLSVQEAPVFREDFKSIVFQRVIHSVLDIRALMTHIIVSIKRYGMVLVNKENKNYAQVQLDDVVIEKPVCKQKMLGRFLRILPLKGYEDTIHPVIDFVEKNLGLNRSNETLLTRALDRIGSCYCPLMHFPHHDLKAGMRADEAVKAVLLTELEIMEMNEDGVLQDIDSEFLHDYRVAIRRTRSALKQIKGIYLKKQVDRYNQAFSMLGRLTGPLRDIHVYLLKIEDYKQHLPDELKQHIEPFRAFLLKHEKIEHHKLVHELSKKRYQHIKQHWRQFLEQAVPDKVHLPNATRTVKEVANEMIWNTYQKILAYGNKINDRSPDEKLHRMRINCKKLRYLLEYFIDIYPQKHMKAIIKSLKNLQSMLGDFQDASVQMNTLRIYETQMKEEGMLTEQTLDAMEYLVTYLDEVKKELRQHYVESFFDLSSDKTQRRFSKLFNPDNQSS